MYIFFVPNWMSWSCAGIFLIGHKPTLRPGLIKKVCPANGLQSGPCDVVALSPQWRVVWPRHCSLEWIPGGGVTSIAGSGQAKCQVGAGRWWPHKKTGPAGSQEAAVHRLLVAARPRLAALSLYHWATLDEAGTCQHGTFSPVCSNLRFCKSVCKLG